jgi:PEP-CTERM motif-containing protein
MTIGAIPRGLQLGLFGFGLVSSLATAAWADTIYTNLGSGGTFNCCAGYGIAGSALPFSHALAAEFVPTSDSLFLDAELPLSVNVGTPSADIYLMSDASGVPGAILEQFSVSGLQPTPTGTLFTVDSILKPELKAGTAYWLAVTAPDASSDVSWRRNTTNDFNSGSDLAGLDSSSSLVGPWTFVPTSTDPTADSRPAFEIDGAAVPEPNSLLLVLFGLTSAGLTVWRRSQRNPKS